MPAARSLLAHCGMLTVLLTAVTGQLAPSIYWHSSPAAAGETVMYAGAFGDSPSAQLCTDKSCQNTKALPLLDGWAHSVKFALPECAPPGCTLLLCASPNGAGPCTTVADPNAPDVWFAIAHPPLSGTSMSPGPTSVDDAVLVNDGTDASRPSLLRVFGRSLAFASEPSPGGPLRCVSAAARQPSATSTLRLDGTSAPILAANATCFELTFDLTGLVLGGVRYPDAAIETPWGVFPLPLVVVATPPAAPLHVISVDTDAAGNVTAALVLAAALGGDKRVVLGARTYALAAPITVPNNTLLVGVGVVSSVLSFDLSAAPGTTPAVTGGSHWGLRALTVLVVAARAKTPAVWMQPGTANFTALGVAVTLQQTNVSNAFRIEGAQFSVGHSIISQGGVCLWPPTDDNTDFLGSTTMLLHGASDGYFHHNTLLWQCSAYDMDISDRIVWEDNVITCTQRGVIPHGNSVSFYSWAVHPSSQGYSYSHNVQSRPANNNRTDWAFHETWTTDGPGGWGAGLLGATDGATIVVPAGLSPSEDPTGASAVVVAGPGAGQYRTVRARVNATAVLLAAPFDAHVVPGASVVAVMATVGGKVISDNAFTWGSVVQAFGTTLGTVFADNRFQDQNNAFADSGAVDGSLTGFGLCYGNEPQSAFYIEYTGNTMNASNGISLHDVSPNAACNATYSGTSGYMRWHVLRGNTIAGVAASSPGVCGTINATNPLTSDLVVERNSFDCPPGNALPGGGVNVLAVHSVVLP